MRFAGRPGADQPFEGLELEDRKARLAEIALRLIDLEAGEMVWADVALERNPRFVNNVHANLHGAALMLRAVVELKKTTLRELFLLHVEARGTLVPTRAEADTVFATDEGVTPFDLPRIAAEYM